MSKPDVTDLIGQKLLQGWTMLAETCPGSDPGCNVVPLMRPRNETHAMCMNCGRFFIPQGDGVYVPEEQEVPRNEVKPDISNSEPPQKVFPNDGVTPAETSSVHKAVSKTRTTTITNTAPERTCNCGCDPLLDCIAELENRIAILTNALAELPPNKDATNICAQISAAAAAIQELKKARSL